MIRCRACSRPVRRSRCDVDEEDVLYPVYKKTTRHLDDKLGAPKRWLASQVGRPWDLVRSELFARFDTRTTAGRHIVYDHMLPWVRDGRSPCACNAPFFADRRGLLRRIPATH